MTIMERPSGNFEVFCYTPRLKRKRYVGTFKTYAEAEAAKALAKDTEYIHRRPRTPKWGIQFKGELECRNCGSPATRLHHIVPRASAEHRWEWNSPLYNGLPLCGSCHVGWHSSAITIHRERLHPEEVAYALKTMGPHWLDVNYPADRLYRQDINAALIDELALLRDENRRLRQRLLDRESP